MAKNVQATSGASGGKKKPTRSPRRRTRAKTAKPAQANPALGADDDDLDDDLARLREQVFGAASSPEPSPESNAKSSSGSSRTKTKTPPPQDPVDYLDILTQAFDNMGSGQWDEDAFDDMTSGAALVLGSGPAFAALGSMMAGATAQSAMLMNATQTKHRLDQVGLCCTSACVKQLLNMNNNGNSD